MRGEALPACDPTPLDPADHAKLGLELHPASTSVHAERRQGENEVAQIAQLSRVDTRVLEALLHVGEPLDDALVAPVRATAEEAGRRAELHFGSHHPPQRLGVAIVVGVDGGLDQIDVRGGRRSLSSRTFTPESYDGATAGRYYQR